MNREKSFLYSALVPGATILGILIIVAVGITWWSNSSQADAPAVNDNRLDAETLQKFNTEYDKLGVAVGRDDAPITIREFADYQCPSCKAFEPTSTRIRNELVQSGKVRFVFFDFPLAMHPNSVPAAIAARCAGRQDHYWAYSEALYDHQSDWASQDDPTDMFLDIAVESGVDAQRLGQCIAQDATRDAVERSRALGEKVGIRATPTIMVGAHVFSGAISYDRISNLIDSQTHDDEEG